MLCFTVNNLREKYDSFSFFFLAINWNGNGNGIVCVRLNKYNWELEAQSIPFQVAIHSTMIFDFNYFHALFSLFIVAKGNLFVQKKGTKSSSSGNAFSTNGNHFVGGRSEEMAFHQHIS